MTHPHSCVALKRMKSISCLNPNWVYSSWSLECEIHQINLIFYKGKHLINHLISLELGRDERGSIRTSPSPQKLRFWRVVRMPRVNINQLLKSKGAILKSKMQSLSTQTGASVAQLGNLCPQKGWSYIFVAGPKHAPTWTAPLDISWSKFKKLMWKYLRNCS